LVDAATFEADLVISGVTTLRALIGNDVRAVVPVVAVVMRDPAQQATTADRLGVEFEKA
jgi:hypothetical protein